ncbi:MAG: hypothetical protein LBJ39_05335, partial [Tannerellaceae bacterium]|nr:hypothetical protein [Tannerellaceae bacterium]
PGHLKWYVNNVEQTSARDNYEWDKTLTPGTYTYRMEIMDNNNQTHTLTTTFTVKNQAVAATITTAGTSICYNSTATLTGSSIAGVTSPVYRWYASQTATTPLYTGPTYTTPSLTATTTYYVSVEGTNYCENVVNTRKAVTVTASSNLTPGSIGTSQSICYNTAPQPLTEITAASGGTYLWQSSPNNSTWESISGATSATYSPPALTANTYYRRAVTSGSCGTVYSAAILITVYPNLTAGAVGSAQNICYNTAPAAFTQTTAAAGGAGSTSYIYQWQYSTDNTSWTNISGATSATYTSGALTANRYFRRAVTSGSCGTVYSASFLVTVYPNLTAGAVGSAQNICYNTAPAAFTQTTAAAGGAGSTSYIYQWQYSTDNTSWTNISGATSATYTSGALTANRYFRRAVTSGSCGTVYSASFLATVYPNLTAGAVGSAQSICYNTAPAAFTQTTAPSGGAGSTSYTYQWQYSTDNTSWTNISGATSATYTAPALTANTYYRRAVTSGNCGTVYTAAILITVQPQVTVNAITGITACATGIVPVTTFTSPTAGVTFSWTNNNTAIGLAASGTGNQPQFTAAKAGTATITVTPYINGCAGTSRTYTITVIDCVAPVNPHLRSGV